jgi:hypothetical protein
MTQEWIEHDLIGAGGDRGVGILDPPDVGDESSGRVAR